MHYAYSAVGIPMFFSLFFAIPGI